MIPKLIPKVIPKVIRKVIPRVLPEVIREVINEWKWIFDVQRRSPPLGTDPNLWNSAFHLDTRPGCNNKMIRFSRMAATVAVGKRTSGVGIHDCVGRTHCVPDPRPLGGAKRSRWGAAGAPNVHVRAARSAAPGAPQAPQTFVMDCSAAAKLSFAKPLIVKIA